MMGRTRTDREGQPMTLIPDVIDPGSEGVIGGSLDDIETNIVLEILDLLGTGA